MELIALQLKINIIIIKMYLINTQAKIHKVVIKRIKKSQNTKIIVRKLHLMNHKNTNVKYLEMVTIRI